MSILAAACRNEEQPAFLKVPCQYMEKIAYGPAVKAGPAQVHLEASVRDNLEIIALKLSKRVQDLNVAVLERKRHEKLIADIRKAGASVRLISDGDVAACVAPSLPGSRFDVYMGTGGGAEAVLAAAAIKCLGGDILARMVPTDDEEKGRIVDTLSEKALKQHFHARYSFRKSPEAAFSRGRPGPG
jgi:fructose-1,6-bisphosphatase II